MAILVGIDEAGYGPLLGPLVVSSVVLEMPEECLRADLWKLLGQAVCAHKKGLAGRLLVNDSKKVYTRSSGIGPLRRTVLSCLNALDPPACPRTAAELIGFLCPDAAERLQADPWYARLDQQPLGQNQTDTAIAGSMLRKTMSENNMRICAVRSRCMDAGFYNQRVEQVKNKSRVLFTEVCSLVLAAFSSEAQAGQPMQVIIDRQGGRINYQQDLLRMFPGYSLSVLRQDDKMSSYELSQSSKIMRIHFCLKADSKYMCVSLASMVSKYLREVLMDAFNAHFCGLCSNLKPTAGYWEDGQRFLKDLSDLLPDYQYDPQKMVRIL